FGSEAYYGDASRLDILTVADAGKAKAMVLAIDDVEASMRTAEIVRANYPDLPIIARARHRNHVHRLMDLGIESIHRETNGAALDMTTDLLDGLGLSSRDVKYTVEMFAEHDERRLVNDYSHFTDQEKMRTQALSDAQSLAKLFDEDALEQARIAESDKGSEIKA
ncbi:MAG: NAD-binding protein, partial [Pseudomonadota bacterium]